MLDRKNTERKNKRKIIVIGIHITVTWLYMIFIFKIHNPRHEFYYLEQAFRVEYLYVHCSKDYTLQCWQISSDLEKGVKGLKFCWCITCRLFRISHCDVLEYYLSFLIYWKFKEKYNREISFFFFFFF